MTRCADWLEEDQSLHDGEPVFVRCELDSGHEADHKHGRFGWGASGWSEQLGPELVQGIVELAADAGDEEARQYLDEQGGEA